MSEKNITQRQLADKLGFVHQRISLWATGRTTPTLKSIKKISDVLNVPLSYFTEEKNCDNSKNNENNKTIDLLIKLMEENNKKFDIEIKYLKEKIQRLEEKTKKI